MTQTQFTFNISLNILNHLGRNLYRNFITILGEAISNAWDADAKNVWIDIHNNSFSIKDDGLGMSEDDFENKFLKVGYSKRKDGNNKSPEERPFIGRKGIGKLALLSCAKKISVQSKTKDQNYVGGVIDNADLDQAISDDSEKYNLRVVDDLLFQNLKKDHRSGTIIYFEEFNNGVKNSLYFLRKAIALYFRFSLVMAKQDDKFNIFLDNKKITLDDLNPLLEKTEFAWRINNLEDPLIPKLVSFKNKLLTDIAVSMLEIKGFVASVNVPKELNILGMGEKVGVDIFVNGRVRDTNILRHIPTSLATQHVASYIYGQIHFNTLDDKKDEDPFTSSRESIKSDYVPYKVFLNVVERDVFSKITKNWNDLRKKHGRDWDIDATTTTPKYQARLEQSKNYRTKDYEEKIQSVNIPEETKKSLKKKLEALSYNNTQIYQDLFILENLFREFLKNKGINSMDALEKKFGKDDKEIKECIQKIKNIKKSRQKDEETHALKGKITSQDSDLNFVDLRLAWYFSRCDTIL